MRRVLLLLIVLLALGLRLLYLYDVSDVPFFTQAVVDQQAYDEWAVKIAAGDWLGDTVFYQAPLYPYGLAVIYALFGRNLVLVYVLQALLASLTCLLLFDLGRRQLGDTRAGLVAALLWALYGVDFFYDAQLLKTAPGVCLGVLALWLLVLARERPDVARVLAAGFVAGLLPLYRGNFLLLLPLLLGWLAWGLWRELGPRSLWRSAAFAAMAFAVLAVVAVRNYSVGGEFVLTTAQAGPNIYIGNNENATGRYVELPFVRAHPKYEAPDFKAEAERRTGRSMSAAEVSRFWSREALSWIRSHPGEALRLQLLKARILLYRVEAPDNLNFAFYRRHLSWVLGLPLVGFWLAGPFGIAGAVLALR